MSLNSLLSFFLPKTNTQKGLMYMSYTRIENGLRKSNPYLNKEYLSMIDIDSFLKEIGFQQEKTSDGEHIPLYYRHSKLEGLIVSKDYYNDENSISCYFETQDEEMCDWKGVYFFSKEKIDKWQSGESEEDEDFVISEYWGHEPLCFYTQLIDEDPDVNTQINPNEFIDFMLQAIRTNWQTLAKANIERK